MKRMAILLVATVLVAGRASAVPFMPWSPLAGAFAPYGAGSMWAGTVSRGTDLSDVITARGTDAVLNSQAAQGFEKARKEKIENNLESAQTFYEMRRIHQKYVDELDKRQHAPVADQVRIGKKMLPRRLTSSQLDPITGKIYWPDLLSGPEFAAPRQQLDQLFEHRSSMAGGIGSGRYEMIQKAVNQMTDQLRTHIDQLHTSNYLYCLEFLRSLAYEAGYLPQ